MFKRLSAAQSLLLLTLALCSCSEGTAKRDAVSAQDAAVETLPSGDAAPDLTGDADGAGAGEVSAADLLDTGAPPETVAEVTPVCGQYAGGYQLNATCNPDKVRISNSMCVAQNGCDVTIYFGATMFSGTATEEGLVTSSEQSSAICTLGPVADSGQLVCEDTTGTPFKCQGTASPETVAGAGGYCCDVVSQDCTGIAEKCTVVAVGQAGALVTTCLPETGTVPEGEPCSRSSEALDGYGHDDCASGLFCTSIISESMEARRCVKMCKSEKDCGDGESCLSGSTSPSTGLCVPACDPFAADCPGQLGCVVRITQLELGQMTAGVCMYSKRLPEGSLCAGPFDCEAGSMCVTVPGETDAKCVQLCQFLSHACTPEGKYACTPLNGLPGFGVCI